MESGSSPGTPGTSSTICFGHSKSSTPAIAISSMRLIDAAYKKRPLAEWSEIFEEQDVVYATFMTTQEFMDYPQVAHNKHVVDVLDHNVGPMKQVGPIAQFLDGEWRWPGPAPLVGQHTEQVLRSPSGDRRPRNTSAATNSGQSTLPAGPLQGVTILDFSLYAAAPGGARHPLGPGSAGHQD